MRKIKNKQAESKVVHAITKMAELVDSGVNPNDALIEAAKATQLTPALIKIAINAYNNGRTNDIRKSGSSIFEKSEYFDVADPEIIIKKLYPDRVKTAREETIENVVSTDYVTPPRLVDARFFELAEKRAYEFAPPPAVRKSKEWIIKKAQTIIDKLQITREGYERDLLHLWDKIAENYDRVRQFLSKPENDFETVKEAALAYFGKAVLPVFAKLAKDLKKKEDANKEKRDDKEKKDKSSDKDKQKEPETRKPICIRFARFTISATPFPQIYEIIKDSVDYKKLLKEAQSFEESATEAEFKLYRLMNEKVEPLPPDYNLSIFRRLNGEKRAFVDSINELMTTGLKNIGSEILSSSLMEALVGKKDIQAALEKLNDPLHENELRKIRVTATLNQVMNSPFLTGEDPRKIALIFNQISKTAPWLVDKPLLLESNIRQILAQGGVDPHTAKQLVELNRDVGLVKKRVAEKHAY